MWVGERSAQLLVNTVDSGVKKDILKVLGNCM